MNPETITALLNAGLIDQATADIMLRQQDDNAARAWAETLVNEASQAGLSAQQQRLLDLVASTSGRPTAAQLGAFWAGENGLLWQALQPALTQVATERAAFAVAQNIDTFALVNQQTINWVNTYYVNGTDPGSVGSLNATTRQQFTDAFTAWQQGEMPLSTGDGLDALINALTPTFGPNRAEMIAITETTRVFVEAQRQAEANNPYTVAFRWLTSADERVCPICGPMHGQVRRKQDGYAGGVDIPAHVRCRCHEVPETEATLKLPLPPEERFVYQAPETGPVRPVDVSNAFTLLNGGE